MKIFLLFVLFALVIVANENVYAESECMSMFRLYNPNSGEHFYTADINERTKLLHLGWSYEGVGWFASNNTHTPVYRLYNVNGGEHHFTCSKAERDWLLSLGWNDEGIGWYSDPNMSVPVYREYNPNAFACNHNYTIEIKEHNSLVKIGWHDEGIAWYGVKYDGKIDSNSALDLFKFLNQKRREKGLSDYHLDPELTKGAEVRAEECSIKFSLIRPDGTLGTTVVDIDGLNVVEEHIANNSSDLEVVYNLWIQDNDFIVKDYDYVGIGCYIDKDYNYFWTIELCK